MRNSWSLWHVDHCATATAKIDVGYTVEDEGQYEGKYTTPEDDNPDIKALLDPQVKIPLHYYKISMKGDKGVMPQARPNQNHVCFGDNIAGKGTQRPSIAVVCREHEGLYKGEVDNVVCAKAHYQVVDEILPEFRTSEEDPQCPGIAEDTDQQEYRHQDGCSYCCHFCRHLISHAIGGGIYLVDEVHGCVCRFFGSKKKNSGENENHFSGRGRWFV